MVKQFLPKIDAVYINDCDSVSVHIYLVNIEQDFFGGAKMLTHEIPGENGLPSFFFTPVGILRCRRKFRCVDISELHSDFFALDQKPDRVPIDDLNQECGGVRTRACAIRRAERDD